MKDSLKDLGRKPFCAFSTLRGHGRVEEQSPSDGGMVEDPFRGLNTPHRRHTAAATCGRR